MKPKTTFHKSVLKTLFIISLLNFITIFGQNSTPKGDVFVDKNGVMRWELSNKEVQGFGVNYTVPFAHAYRSAKRMGRRASLQLFRYLFGALHQSGRSQL